MSPWVLGIDLDLFLEFGDRFVIPFLMSQGLSQIVVSIQVLGIHDNRISQRGFSFVVLPERVVGPSQIVPCILVIPVRRYHLFEELCAQRVVAVSRRLIRGTVQGLDGRLRCRRRCFRRRLLDGYPFLSE